MSDIQPVVEAPVYACSASVIDANPPWMPWEPRPADAPPLLGPTLKEALYADGLATKGTKLYEWYSHSRVGRALARYGLKRGHLLAGGISYVAMFSITAAVAIGWTIFMAVLGHNEPLRVSTLTAIDKAMPGLLITPDDPNNGLLNPDSLILKSPFTIAGFIATVSLFLSASRVMAALKTSLWSMFGIVHLPDKPVVAQVRDYAGFFLLTLGVLVTAALGVLTSTLSTLVIEALGISGAFSTFLLQASSLLIAFLVDAVVFAILVRFIAGVRVPKWDLIWGSLMLGVASGAVRYLGTSAVGSVNDPVLAAGAAVITLMLWINLIARLVLMIAAWMANPPFAGAAKNKAHVHGVSFPNYVSMSAPETLDWPRHTLTGDMDRDPRHDPDAVETVLDSSLWNSRRVVRLRVQIERLEEKLDKLRRELWSLGVQKPQK
ncbi:ribonuclease BN-like family protein [Gleimia coleocanis DSM 15436]|uniref:Ribonuclease BN-like family protein n=1 Tax=Gleimia coleocanis DSM 15436 TaxID=525245 RepID=C0VZL3_9ACTO|nr:YihY/virulence factor BrkB family protein [Gleimia coleocanis]EEH64132.1 ribonuclease BN-like family protein [Gleimia coleocanis DSM 15436]